MTASEKAAYIFYYYKWHMLITVIVLIALISFINDRLNAKETIFSITFINSGPADISRTSLVDDFSETLNEFDPSKQEILLESGIWMDLDNPDPATIGYDEKMVASYTVGSIDATVADRAVIEKYAPFQAYANLELLLPEDLKEELSAKGYEFLYVEMESPVTGERAPVPVGVFVEKSLGDFFDPSNGHSPIYAISSNSSHVSCAIDFLRYLAENDPVRSD